MACEHIDPKIIARLTGKGLQLPDPRPHLNIVFIGHVDAGKSTTCGYILCKTGQVDARTLDKYEREAKENNRESWYYAYVMDINEEERAKGKTTEVGRATFALGERRFTILDAPGHKSFVPEMVSGASQADIGVLIISARKGEFEAGFERGGQTQEHALLAKTLGVNQLIVAVNKMDDQSCRWNRDRYDTIVSKLTGFLKSCGFNPAKDVTFVPISGLTGQNIDTHIGDPSCPNYTSEAAWYGADSPSLFDALTTITLPERSPTSALRVPLLSGYRDNGIIAVGKVESGVLLGEQSALLMPNNVKVKINSVHMDTGDVAFAAPGENVEISMTGVDEEAVRKGCVICSVEDPISISRKVKAQFVMVDCLEHKPLLTSGYRAIFHAHTVSEECEITTLLETVNKADRKLNRKPHFARVGMVVTAVLVMDNPIAIDSFEKNQQMGRFTLRDEGKTIAIGKILKVAA